MTPFGDSALDPIARDIWDMKYRLKRLDGSAVDETIDDSWRRVARAVAQAEAYNMSAFWGIAVSCKTSIGSSLPTSLSLP